ncbi:hypothetical protein BTVI_68852 [Pitangus sulphuratus]|nr:hypothetical protein BTVI_68852 [Pitangus sulphuratus]
MRGLGHYGCIPEDGGHFLLYSINGDNSLKRCFAEEDFHEIIDFNDLPNSLFACNVHQSVFEDEDSKGHVFMATAAAVVVVMAELNM